MKKTPHRRNLCGVKITGEASHCNTNYPYYAHIVK